MTIRLLYATSGLFDVAQDHTEHIQVVRQALELPKSMTFTHR